MLARPTLAKFRLSASRGQMHPVLPQVRHVEVRFDGYSKVEIGPVGRHLFVKIDDGRLESIVSVANTPLSSWHLTRIELALLEVLGQDTPEDEDDEKEDDEA